MFALCLHKIWCLFTQIWGNRCSKSRKLAVSLQYWQGKYLGQVLQTWSKVLHLRNFWSRYTCLNQTGSVNFQSLPSFYHLPPIKPAPPFFEIVEKSPRALKVLDITSRSVPFVIGRIGAHSAGVNLNQIHRAVCMRSQHKNPLTTWRRKKRTGGGYLYIYI